MFTLNEVACLGCCSLAPVMMINGDTYGNLTPEKTIKILRQLRQREAGNGIRILVGQGSCGVSAGAARVAKVLAGHMTATDSFTVETTGCIGMCYLEPIVDIYEGEQLLHRLVRVTETDALESPDDISPTRWGSWKRCGKRIFPSWRPCSSVMRTPGS